MDDRDAFKITYSAEDSEEIKAIREKYISKEESPLERLRRLDEAVTKKATAASIAVGIVGTLIMGFGMSLIMSDFGMLFKSYGFLMGIILGIIGIAVIALAYPMYSYRLKKEREKTAPEILRLTDELSNRK